ncbi:MAG: ABC transporter ATP-binding protein/permease [Anaeromicrobium sp.]|jgi:ATP-binding cassette subfamily B protein|uniref:ABC transporter ATP-binding protein n=1 Tax=Anaeromicrobium sp. TaxID=1929132 RepID=UPI0025EBB75F|nr:ABC transporter ATP-binding protein [Anaeromicrobium sp.]MCT4596144.1 ABC transporter ATP-binding protein/permease [Anaeromicrobium sp.]
MFKIIQNKFALSEQGTKDLLKGSIYSALVNLSMMIPVGIFILMLDELLRPVLGKEATTPNMLKYMGLILVAVVISYLFHHFQYSNLYLSTYKESAKRRIALGEKLRELPLSFFGKRDLSDLTNIIMGDCAILEHAFSHAIPQLFGSILSTTMIVISLLIMDWRMGLAVLWVIPVSFTMIFLCKQIQQKSKEKHYKSKYVCADGIQECLENIQDIKAYHIEKSYMEGLDKKLDDSEKAQIKSELTTGAIVTSAQAVLRLGLATVILVGSSLLIKEQTDLLTYFIFLVTASRLYDPLSGNLTNIAEVFSTEMPIKRMNEIENYKVQTGKKDYEPNSYHINFNHVGFSYNNDETVLKDVSFTAKQGEVTALIGPSGSGKSTAAKLAARFWDVNKGSITIGGEDITKVEPEALLKNYTIVFQDVTLFNDTVMENIRLGKREASDEEVLKAAKLAMCDDFVSSMPKGYETIIGENGSTLSGGERQRISIARALLKDSPIILLDEATASLDVENETKIQRAISELIKDKTVIVVAHRMRTVENADKVVVLSDGYVKEQGKPKDLLEKEGMYKHMVQLQSESMNWSL